MNRKKKQPAIERLLRDKAHLEERIKASGQDLDRDFAYIRDNASSLLLAGFTFLFFPGKQKKKKPSAKDRDGRLTTSDWMAVGRGFMPLMWEIVQPYLLTWSINGAKKFVAGIFSKKKKGNSLHT